jgi:H+/Cl- antiporter ClcA
MDMTTSTMHLILLIIAVLWFAATVWAIVVVVRSRRYSPVEKLIWCVVLILFPGAGLLAWGIELLVRRNRPSPQG